MALDFLILYEHIVREFENNCLIMAELRRRGYTVELMQLMSCKKLKYFFHKKPKVIVTSAMYDNETLNSFVYNNVGKLQKVVNLHWEEVLSREQEESDFYSLKENAAKCTHICWGESAKKRIVKNGVPEKNAVVTGAVQLDFLLPQFAGYYRPKKKLSEDFGLDYDKNWILYISSFSCASMDDSEIEELNAMTDLDFWGFRQVGNRSMKATLDWFDRLLIDRPDTLLIYRPHPSEWESEPLKNMIKKHSNFKVITDSSVKEWVLVCDKIFTWMSTSIAEVFYSNKTCIVIRPEPLYSDYDPVIYESCDAVDNYEELISRFDKEFLPFPINGEIIEEHYDFDIKKPAYIRICDLLEDVYKNPPRDFPFSEGYKPRFNLLKFIILPILNLMVTLKIKPKYFSFLFGKNFIDKSERMLGYIEKSRISKKEIERKIEQFRKYIG